MSKHHQNQGRHDTRLAAETEQAEQEAPVETPVEKQPVADSLDIWPPTEFVTDADLVPLAASSLRVFEVEIPNCLLGKKVFVLNAADIKNDVDGKDKAYLSYKKLGGITSHVSPVVVNELQPGCEGYIAAVAAYEAAEKVKAEAAVTTVTE